MVKEDSQEPTDAEWPVVRAAVQEIITAHVVLKDRAERDRLIAQHLDDHGGEAVIEAVVAFITEHAARDVEVEVVEDRFYYMLTPLGRLASVLAELDGSSEAEVIQAFASEDYQYSENPGDNQGPVAERAMDAVRGVQCCLVAHYFVRRGETPWGIQTGLDLDDMCSVVDGMGFLLGQMALNAEEGHYGAVVTTLMEDVDIIVRAVAAAREEPVSQLVATYFTGLMRKDLGLEGG